MSSRRHTNDQQVTEKVLSITKHQENGNQNYNEISPLTSLGYFIYIYIQKCWQEFGKTGTIVHYYRDVNWYIHYRKQ